VGVCVADIKPHQFWLEYAALVAGLSGGICSSEHDEFDFADVEHE